MTDKKETQKKAFMLLERVEKCKEIDVKTLGLLTHILLDKNNPNLFTLQYMVEQYNIPISSVKMSRAKLKKLGIMYRKFIGYGEYITIINYDWREKNGDQN